MNTYYVYIIHSPKADVLYKGFTTSPEKRLRSHNAGENSYTRYRGPWSFLYLKKMGTKTEALAEERRLKKQNRRYLNWLIDNDPDNLITFPSHKALYQIINLRT